MAASPEAIAEVLVEPEGLDWDDVATAFRREEPDARPTAKSNAILSWNYSAPAPLLPKNSFFLNSEKYQLAGSPGSAFATQFSRTYHLSALGTEIIRVAADRSVGQDYQEALPQTTSLIDVSHRGARVGGVAFHPRAGEVVHLVSDRRRRTVSSHLGGRAGHSTGRPNRPAELKAGR